MNHTIKINSQNKMLEEKIDKKDIIWNEVIMQIGDDKDFLIEILNDFKNELDIAENEIQLGINLHDLLIIKKTAQSIKESGSYLYCEKIQYISLQIEKIYIDENISQIDEKISQDEKNKVIENIKHLFDIFSLYKRDLFYEIDKYVKENL